MFFLPAFKRYEFLQTIFAYYWIYSFELFFVESSKLILRDHKQMPFYFFYF